MSAKSDRLRKLEAELQDLEHWLKLDLVPKKDLKQHKDEIKAIQKKIEEEHSRMQNSKDSGQDEYITPKRQNQRPAYSENPTISGIDVDNESNFSDTGMDNESDAGTDDSAYHDEDEDSTSVGTDEDEPRRKKKDIDEDLFSDKGRYRSGFRDPDAEDYW